MNEKKKLLNMLKELWQNSDSPLRRIYASWDELEANLEIKTEKTTRKEKYALQPCPYCGAKQKVANPLEGFFSFQSCKACKQTFHVNKNLTARRLTNEEKDMPTAWFQIFEDISKKKLAISFRIE